MSIKLALQTWKTGGNNAKVGIYDGYKNSKLDSRKT
jgi:hypothetical protein